jgi:signal peptidase II
MQTEGRAPIGSSRALSARRLFIAVSCLIFAVDLTTKNWAANYLQFREPIKLIGDFLRLTYGTNPGAGFSFATDATAFLSTLKLCVAAFIIYFVRKVTNKGWAIGLGLLLGGVMGNLWDRITRPPGLWRGEVVDWIQLPNWPIFNIADSAIICAGVLLTILTMRNIQPFSDKFDSEKHGK